MIKEKDAEGAAALIHSHVDRAQESLVKVLQARDNLQNDVLSLRRPTKGTPTFEFSN